MSVGARGPRESSQDSYASGQATVSADGRYVVFESRAARLVSGDTNQNFDVFVRDRAARHHRAGQRRAGRRPGERRQSVASLAISADGRFVAFDSDATNLVPNDTNHRDDNVFVHDRQKGTTERVERGTAAALQANWNSEHGRWRSRTTGGSSPSARTPPTSSPGDTNDARDVFVRDRATGRTERVSVRSNGAQANRSRLGDGDLGRRAVRGLRVRRRPTSSRTTPTAEQDVFVHDRQTGRTERVSLGPQRRGRPTATATTRDLAATGATSPSSRDATNLVQGDTNGRSTSSSTTARAGPPSASASGRAASRPTAAATPRRSRGTAATWPSPRPPRTSSRATPTAATDVFVRDRRDRRRPSG